MIRCKFRLKSVTQREGFTKEMLYDAEFTPVTDGSPENKDFWRWTPEGQLKVATVKQMPWTIGKEYYLDITEA